MIAKVLSLFNREDKAQLYALMVCLVFTAFLETLGVGLIMPFIAMIQNPTLVEHNRWAVLLYSTLGSASYYQFILYCSLGILAFYVLKNLGIGWTLYWQSKFLSKTEADISVRMLKTYLAMPYEQYLLRNTAELVNNITIETALLFTGLVKPLFIIISDVLVVAAVVVLLIFVAPGATFAAMATLGISSVLFYLPMRKHLRDIGIRRQHHKEKMVQWVNQSLGSMKEMIVMNKKSFFTNSFLAHAQDMIHTQTFSETAALLPRLVIESFGVIVLVVITMILLKQPEHFLPTIALFAMAAFRLMPAMQRITACATKVRFYLQALDTVHRDLHISPADAPSSASVPVTFRKELRLQGVNYSYTGTTTPILQGLSLHIRKGESVGIIGHSGAGKTTLVDIILGLLRPQHGSITADSIDIFNDLSGWRAHISYMPQVVYLTDDTIRRNIAFGIPDNQIDEVRLARVIEQAQLVEFVRNQPHGLDTLVGERGARMSGGQRQRMGIARALYNQPDILILDEATTGLDPETEKAICQTLKTMKNNLTMIVISHQPELISIADTIYTLKDGMVTPLAQKVA